MVALFQEFCLRSINHLPSVTVESVSHIAMMSCSLARACRVSSIDQREKVASMHIRKNEQHGLATHAIVQTTVDYLRTCLTERYR